MSQHNKGPEILTVLPLPPLKLISSSSQLALGWTIIDLEAQYTSGEKAIFRLLILLPTPHMSQSLFPCGQHLDAQFSHCFFSSPY